MSIKARIIVGASHAYACITGDTFSMDVQLAGAMSASTSLIMSATDERVKAAHCLERAERMESAARILDGKRHRSHASILADIIARQREASHHLAASPNLTEFEEGKQAALALLADCFARESDVDYAKFLTACEIANEQSNT